MIKISYFLRVGCGLGLLILLISIFSPSKVISIIHQLNVAYLLASVALVAISTLIGAISIYILFEPEIRPSFSSFFPTFWFSWAIGLIFPGQIGDVASLSMLLQKRGIEFHATLGRSAADKLISLILMSGIGLWGVGQIPIPAMHINVTTAWLILGVVAAMLTLHWGKWLWRWLSLRLPEAIETLLKSSTEAQLLIKRHPMLLGVNMGLTFVKIMLAGASYWYVFRALGYSDMRLIDVVPLVAASSLVAYLPISLNGMGTAEVAGIALFGSLGLPPSAVLTAYLALRVSVLILAWVPASLWLLFARQEAHRQPLDPG